MVNAELFPCDLAMVSADIEALNKSTERLLGLLLALQHIRLPLRIVAVAQIVDVQLVLLPRAQLAEDSVDKLRASRVHATAEVSQKNIIVDNAI